MTTPNSNLLSVPEDSQEQAELTSRKAAIKTILFGVAVPAEPAPPRPRHPYERIESTDDDHEL